MVVDTCSPDKLAGLPEFLGRGSCLLNVLSSLCTSTLVVNSVFVVAHSFDLFSAVSEAALGGHMRRQVMSLGLACYLYIRI